MAELEWFFTIFVIFAMPVPNQFPFNMQAYQILLPSHGAVCDKPNIKAGQGRPEY